MSELADKINRYSAEFDKACFDKHEMGEQKYGHGTWLGIDTMEHLKDEVVDAANYARMTYIKLCLVQDGVARIQSEGQTAAPLAGKEMLGKDTTLFQGGMPG